MAAPPAARTRLHTVLGTARRVRAAQRRGERVVLSSGCFDILHVGHVRSLEQARRLGDRLVVGLNADATVRRLKGPRRPVVPARQRAEVIAALGCVDWVVIFAEPTPRELIAALQPDVYAKGGDWTRATLIEKDVPPGFEGRVVRLRQIPRVRTSRILDRVRLERSGSGRRPTR
ncbi:MAG: adenylyltransferase/cytidyltransferase family protein [Deltaproteobacteria bacterium]|nr:MAG: adenylyltransferase/cytidyltransferase family protein [Deltaproteobacteria bacterium]